MIHQPLLPDGVHPQISSFQRLLVLCLVRLALSSHITACLFFQRLQFIGSLDKYHTSVFNALILTLLDLAFRFPSVRKRK